MNVIKPRLSLSILLLLAVATPLMAQERPPGPEQTRLQGIVRVAEGRPLEGARVVVEDAAVLLI